MNSVSTNSRKPYTAQEDKAIMDAMQAMPLASIYKLCTTLAPQLGRSTESIRARIKRLKKQ